MMSTRPVTSPAAKRVVTGPPAGLEIPKLRDLWGYRETLYFLAWRDVKVRYQQTLLGAAWAVLRPLLTVLIISVVFGHFARIPSAGAPYLLYCLAALLPWMFFSTAVIQSTESLVRGAPLISKVYFPRIIFPTAATLACLIDFGVTLVLLVLAAIVYRQPFHLTLLALPVCVAYLLGFSLAVSLWLSALNARFRDVGHAVPFVMQIWMYATPVLYPASFITGRLHLAIVLNPMSSVVESFRWCIFGRTSLGMESFAIGIVVMLALLASGLLIFQRTEDTIADLV